MDPGRVTRGAVVGGTAAALVVVLAIVGGMYDDGPSPSEQRCAELRAAANGVVQREDTVDDEVTYLRLARRADRFCRSAD